MEWDPTGPITESLLAKLDKVQIGRGRYSEAALERQFECMSAEELRQHFKVPEDAVLPDGVAPDPRYLDAWLEGLRRVVKGRGHQERAMVRAYNKAKHGLLGIYGADQQGRTSVILLSGEDYAVTPVQMHRAFVRAEPDDIRNRVAWTIQMQAVLQSILGFILGVHFGQWVDTPLWAVKAYESEGWVEPGPPSK
jgi:hypothetical protein